MKTHELAKALSAMSQLLKRRESLDLDEVDLTSRRHPQTTSDMIPVALSTLVALAKFDKSQWLEIIKAYDFPVEVRPRDASRDILGKILRHLEESPEARNRLAHQATKSQSDTSPELLRALQLLLRK